MKKTFMKGLILSFILCLCLTCVLTACDNDKPSPIENADKIIVEVSETGIAVFYSNPDNEKETIFDGETEKTNLSDLIDELTEKELIATKSTTSIYGAYFTEIGKLVPSGTQYLYFYTNLADYEETQSEWSTTVTYSGKVYKGANVGASSLPLTAGAVYVIAVVG